MTKKTLVACNGSTDPVATKTAPAPPTDTVAVKPSTPKAAVKKDMQKAAQKPPTPKTEVSKPTTPIEPIAPANTPPAKKTNEPPTRAPETPVPPPVQKVEAAPEQKPVAPPAESVAAPIIPAVPKLPAKRRERPLPPVPDQGLIEKSAAGPLPIVGRDGREAWRVYARPFNAQKSKPKIAIVLYGLGTSATASRAAIQGLPGAITLAFSPYASGLTSWIREARTAGHEVLLMVPMEPTNYPQFDPGPQALLTTLSDKENTSRLQWVLDRGVGYVGVVNFMGSRFTRSHSHMRMVLSALRKRGLLYLESHSAMRNVIGDIARTIKLPFAATILQLDATASRLAIDSQLRETERLARQLGHAVAMGFPYPVTLERIGNWAKSVEKRGFSLAPVSAVSKRSAR
ncbi:MAG: divergent polysaccharide deacetylase family protein [Boseongicola sp.]|nr:divergent polysaccharide deacetylase family protein [Boseongicola sp.]